MSNELKEKFVNLVKENVKRDGIYLLLDYIENDTDFYTSPASTMFHGNYEGGLVEHSLNVFNMLVNSPYVKNYSMETLAIVSLFHDLCKANTYITEMRNTKNECGQWVKVPYYKTSEKYPFGHGEKSVYLLMKYIKLTDEEALAINWHMGGFDQRVKGGSYSIGETFNQSVLALELHLADMRATYIAENKNNNSNNK